MCGTPREGRADPHALVCATRPRAALKSFMATRRAEDSRCPVIPLCSTSPGQAFQLSSILHTEHVPHQLLHKPHYQSPNGLAGTLPSLCPVCISVPFKYLLLSTVTVFHSSLFSSGWGPSLQLQKASKKPPLQPSSPTQICHDCWCVSPSSCPLGKFGCDTPCSPCSSCPDHSCFCVNIPWQPRWVWR